MQLFSDNTALRAHFESQADFMHALSQKSFDLLRQASELNLKLARQEIEGTLYASRDIMACGDPMQMVLAAMRQIPPAAERLRSYQQHLLSLMSGGQLGETKPRAAAETRLPAASRSASEVADEVLQRAAASAPAAGAGNVIVNGSGSAAGETHH